MGNTCPSFWMRLAHACLVVLLSALPAHAGTGKYNSGKFDFVVTIQFNASNEQVALIEQAFEEGSKVLQWATHGQHRFGTIFFTTDTATYSEDEEFRIFPGDSRAWATHGMYGTPGQSVTLFFDSDFNSDYLPAEASAFTIAHEFAHHAYDVRDEYNGPDASDLTYDDDGIWLGTAECAPRLSPFPQTPDDDDLDFCLMDNFFARGGNFGQFSQGPYTLNLFCNPCNHDPDQDTFQESAHQQSCWETIDEHPTHPANMQACLGPFDIFLLPIESFLSCCFPFEIALVIDRSLPMEQNLFFAQQGAKGLIDHLPDGTILSIISFGGNVQLNLPPTPLNVDTRLLADQAIDGLALGGLVNSGDGLMEAVNLFNLRPSSEGNQAIVFITGADQQVGIPLPDVLSMATQRLHLQVFTIGVSDGLSFDAEGTLQNIAWLTGGEFHRVASPSSLIGVYERLAQRSQNRAALMQKRLAVPAGAPVAQRVRIEPGVGLATFSISFADAADQVSLSLITPSGQIINEATLPQFPSVRMIEGSHGQAFEVRSPALGQWTMSLSGAQLSQGWVDTAVHVQSPGSMLGASAGKPIHHGAGPIRVLATAQFFNRRSTGQATPATAGTRGTVLNAAITATVHSPNGTTEEIQLLDDGSVVNGDAEAHDGTYSAMYQHKAGPGTYAFTLRSTASGRFYPGELLFAEFAPANTGVAPRFQRSAYTTTVVLPAP